MLPRPLEFGEDFVNPEAAAGILNRFLEYPEGNLRENCWELLSGRLGRELLMFTQEVIRFLCVKRTRESRVRSVLYMVLVQSRREAWDVPRAQESYPWYLSLAENC